jgi:replicative DNA helicase
MFPKTRRYFKLKKSLLQVLFHIQIILQKSSYYRHSSCQNQLSKTLDQQTMANEETNDEAFDAALEETFEVVMKETTQETIEETKETMHETCEEITAKALVRLKFVFPKDQ